MGLVIRLLLIASCLSCLATAGEARLDVMRMVRGPWQWRTADGAPHIGCITSGVVVLPPVIPIDGRPELVTSANNPLPNEADLRAIILHLPVGTHGTARWAIGHDHIEIKIPPPIARDAVARFGLTSARAWPDQAAIATLTKHLGGTPQFMLALGDRIASRLGTGGWESSIPVVVVAHEDPALTACLGGADAAWRYGIHAGVLGMPTSPDRSRADLALARDLSPWLVYLDLPPGWDPASGREHPGSPSTLGSLLATCNRLSVPLILGAGISGLVSDPLILTPSGSVQVAPGGVRYVLPSPAGDGGLAALPNEIALPLDQPMISGLIADIHHLDLILARPDDTTPLRLRWSHGDDPGPAAGRSDGAVLAKRLATAESLDTPASQQDMERLCWLSRAAMLAAGVTPELAARLRDEGGPFGKTAARRYAVMRSDDQAVKLPGEPDPQVARDVLLWQLTNVRGRDAMSWREHAAVTTDLAALSALLAEAARPTGHDLLPALIRRVELQSEGTLPLDTDPLLQHRLFTVVFDNVHLSPTPLRPMALKLRDQVSLLGRGPIDRFLKRHGEMRPVP